MLFVHIASGTLALVAGLIASFSQKGRQLHRNSGQVFFYAMLIAGLSAIWLSVLRPSWFLLGIGLFSTYLTVGGKLVLQRAPLDQLSIYWRVYTASGLIIAFAMVLITWLIYQKGSGAAIVLGVFATLQLLTVWSDWRHQPDTLVQRRISLHLGKMGGAYIATLTAFLVQNVQFLPSLLVWLGPTVIGSILLSRAGRKWRKQRSLRSAN